MIGNMNAVVEICAAACKNCCCVAHSGPMPDLLDKVIDCLTHGSEAAALSVDMKALPDNVAFDDLIMEDMDEIVDLISYFTDLAKLAPAPQLTAATYESNIACINYEPAKVEFDDLILEDIDEVVDLISYFTDLAKLAPAPHLTAATYESNIAYINYEPAKKLFA